MKKRVIAFLMCMLMMVTAVPVSPFADFVKIDTVAASDLVNSLEPFSTLTSGKLNMIVGGEETFKVMVLPSTAENKSLTWSSSKTSVVSVSDPEVSSSGIASVKLHALSVGSAVITYSTTDGSDISGSFTVVVSPLVSSLTLNQSVKSIVPGSQGEKLVATVAPSDAGNQVLRWFSSDESVCTVDRNGVLTPVSQGECTISVATTDGSDIIASCRLVVANKSSSVTLSKASAILENSPDPDNPNEKKSIALYATVTTTDGYKHDAVKWTSSDTKVATVDQEGYVTAKYPGKTIIKATTADGLNKYASCTIIVTQKITGLTLDKKISVGVGETAAIKATYSPDYATKTDLTWTSSDPGIASVSSSGVVSGVSEGTATITCENSDGSVKAMCTVNVVVPATGISITSSSHELWKDDGVQLYALVTPAEATDKSVTWSSSNTAVATVSSEGYVTAVAGGSCTIKAVNSAGHTASCKITVLEKAGGIEMDEIVKRMYVGQVDKLIANVLPATATERGITWKSSDESVVAVEADGTVKAFKVGDSIIITATTADGNYSASCNITVVHKTPVEDISLDRSSLTLDVSDTFQFLVKILPSNASEKRVKWSTDNAAVASISSTGVVTALNPGSAIITATSYDGNYSASCKITVVQPVTGVTLSASSAKISLGKSKTVTCTVLPSNASNKSVIWSSSDESVATVSNGVITAKKAGSAVIYVKTADGNFTAACNVTVVVTVTGVSISVSSLEVPKGETRVVTAVIEPAEATDQAVTWSSSDEKIAKVSSTGKITGVAKGTAVITCKTSDGSFEARCSVTVVQLVEKVKLDATALTLQVGKYKTLTAKATPSSASDSTIKWKSSDKKIAEVSSKGVVKAKAAGTATITAYSADSGSAKATCKVTVTQPATGIKLNEKKATVAIGKTITLKATVLPSNVSNKKVTWISDNTERATVSSSGVVKGLKQGYVTITAKTADGRFSASCKVLVAKGVTGVKLDKTSITLNVGKSTTITPTISPKDATVKTVKWSSDNNDVATVDKNGKVTAVGAGSATITAKSSDGARKATASVLVIKPVKSVSLNKKSAYIDVGEKLTLKPVFKPSDASIRTVTWKSSNKSVAAVSDKGVVKGKKIGTATITCTTKNGKKVATCKISVVKKVTGISLSHSNEILYFGKTLKLKTTVYPADATVKTVTYKSSNSKVAKVSDKGVVTPLSVGTAKITVTSKDGSFKKVCTVAVKKAPEKIKVSSSTATLKVGQQKTISYKVTPADATNKTATFKSSNTSVVSVTSKGVITGLSKGKATITLTTENGLKAKVTVTVKQQVTSVEVTPTATVYTEEALTLYASVLPTSAENKTLKWSSSDTSVVKVTSNGVITGIRTGEAIITVVSAENSALKATCEVTVLQHVTSLAFNKADVFVTKGGQAQLEYTLSPANASNKNVTFMSSDPDIVSVASDGSIVGVNSGTADVTITAADNGMTSVCHVTVGEPVSGVSLDYKEKTVFVGETLTLVPTVSPSDAYNKNVRWSSDSANASVDSTGLITALKSGKAVITATTVDGGFQASCELTLLQRATSVEVEEAAVKVLRGATYQFNATVLPEDCYDKSFEWTSEDSDIAEITADGFVTAKAPGTVKLICTSLESGVYTTVEFTVHEPVTGFEVEENEVTLYTPLTRKLTTSFLPLDASDKSVTWTSSDENVVKVSEDGVVTAVGKGEAIVTAKSNDADITDTCKFIILTGVEDIITGKDAYSLHETTSLEIDYSFNPEAVDDPRVTFTSSDESIFTVTDDGIITGIVPGEATLTIASVQNPDVTRVVPITVTRAVTDIEISDSEKLMYTGDSFTVTATVSPADASDKTVIWTSSDESVATVDADGKVTAVSRGFAEITATTRDGGFTKQCSIEVVQLPEEVVAGADSATAYMGSTLALDFTVLPEDTNDKTLTWSSSDVTVATVDSDGVVTPVNTGSCYITASSIIDGIEKTIELTVVQLAESVVIKSRVVDLFPGQKLRILTEVLPETTTDKSIEWISSDESVASVDGNGIVTAHNPGIVELTVRSLDDGGVSKVVTLNVVSEITGISLSDAVKTLELSDSFKLTATVEPAMAYDKTVTYKSSDSNVASVDEDGNVTGLSTGQAVITATTVDGSFSASVTVTVIKSAEDIELLRTEFSLNKGAKVMVDYDILPADATQTDVTWESSDSEVATVDKNGIITAVASGTATITLTVTGTSIKKTVTVTVE